MFGKNSRYPRPGAARASGSGARRSGRTADLPASNGACAIVVRYSTPMRTATGMPGVSIMATISARITSQATMTSRRGIRSPRPEKTRLPTIHGSEPAA